MEIFCSIAITLSIAPRRGLSGPIYGPHYLRAKPHEVALPDIRDPDGQQTARHVADLVCPFDFPLQMPAFEEHEVRLCVHPCGEPANRVLSRSLSMHLAMAIDDERGPLTIRYLGQIAHLRGD